MDAENFMRRAIDLAERGRGRTSPNPLVGAVVVKDGRVVGEGFHPRAGLPHAEIYALQAAGAAADGATLYVTLEPCCHQGKTPPCTRAAIEAGIRAVVVGLVDPNPQMNGCGVAELREAGLAVSLGPFGDLIARQNEIYLKYITTGQPFVLAKWAISLDGKLAEAPRRRTLLTAPKAQAEVHLLRSHYDAVMVGVGTALVDDPQLTVRLIEGKQPLRVVVDSRGRLPLDSQLVKTAGETPTLVATTTAAEPAVLRSLTEAGVEMLTCESDDQGVDLVDLMRKLGQKGITSVMVEGGARLNASLLDNGLVDKFALFIAPKILGSPDGVGLVDRRVRELDVSIVDVRQLDNDIMIMAYPAAMENHRAVLERTTTCLPV